jgi:hypothetical protein
VDKFAETELEANGVLTLYNEYTLRPTVESGLCSWSRVAVTQESLERHLIEQRVRKFEAQGGNVLEIKLRMTDSQNEHANRIINELKLGDADLRFEWSLVEVSLHKSGSQSGTYEITKFIPGEKEKELVIASMMHIIVKRSLRRQYRSLAVYHSLMATPPAPKLPPQEIISLRRDKKYDSDSDSTFSRSSRSSSVGRVRSKYSISIFRSHPVVQ